MSKETYKIGNAYNTKEVKCSSTILNSSYCIELQTRIQEGISVDASKQTNHFYYLGQTITNDTRCKIKINNTIEMVRIAFYDKQQIVKQNEHFTTKILKTHI